MRLTSPRGGVPRHGRRFLVILAVLFFQAALLLTAHPSRADEFSDGLPALAKGSYDDKIAAASALVATGDDRAGDVVKAFSAGNLYVRKSDGAIFVGRDGAPSGQALLTDPVSGQDLGAVSESDYEKIRVNNKVRRALDELAGGLALLGKDPAKRKAAAAGLFGTSDASQAGRLTTALEKEKDKGVAAAMRRSLASINIGDPDPAKRLAAVKELANSPDQQVRALLLSRLVETNGKPAEPDEEVRTLIDSTLSHINLTLQLWNIVGSLYQGLSLGAVLLLAAIGLAVTFGVMGVINMAHGEMIMLGAYSTFVVQQVIAAHAPWLFQWSLAIALPTAFLVSAIVGIVIERGIIRFLYGRPLETLLATWGVSLVLQQAVRSLFGPSNRAVVTPDFMQGAIETSVGITLTYNRLYIIAFAVVVLAALFMVLQRTPLGLQMRAVTQNRRMAAAMGIPTARVDAFTFGLGSGIAGLAGVALSQIDNVSPNLGQGYIVDSFMVVVFGGVGNLWGTVAGALSLGIVNKLLEPFAGAVLGKILVLVAIILFIQKRPRGLFALKGRSVEA
ncbi:urea ABC transporter permease subunit UrtB [Radicibacter daui]|uniref:urea ABC transporter permease subunit UrtB n=1 Tax=Radicibacter daui TaxID=3064829 RepID=UPI00404695BD